MLNALINHKEQSAVLSLPMDRFSLQYELAQIGIRQRLTDIPISDEEEHGQRAIIEKKLRQKIEEKKQLHGMKMG